MTNKSERTAERVSERVSLTHQGPQHFPAQFRDENFHYRWVNYVPDKLWKALEAERIGYDPVPMSELGLTAKSKVIKVETIVQEGYLTCPLKGGGQAVLMRLPMSVYLEREKAKKQERIAAQNAMVDEGLDLSSSEGTKKTFSFTNTK